MLAPQRLVATPLDPDDAMLFDIRLGELRMGDGTHGYQTKDGVCADFRDVTSALDIAVEIAADKQSAAGWVFDEHALLTIDRRESVVKARGRIGPLLPADITETDTGWCVLTEALARWFGLSITVDTLNALLLVHSETRLPAQEARERSSQASQLSAKRAARDSDAKEVRKLTIPYRLWRTPSFDVGVQLGTSDHALDRRYEIYSAGEALWMSMDARLASDTRGEPNALRARLYRQDPDAALLGPLRATEIAVGDVSSAPSRLTTHSASGRGISLTNRPLGRASQFDTTSFQGDLPQGWDVELFRNGELIGLSRGTSEGRYRFLDVPLIYGSNLFEIVRHGPQGQTRRERHSYEVGPSAVPPGKLWWWADVVEQNRDLIGLEPSGRQRAYWRQDVGMEYGIGKRTSMAVSLHSLARNTALHTVAEVEIRRAIATMTLTATGAADKAKRRALMLSGLGRAAGFRFSFTTLFNRGLDSDQVDKATRTSRTLTLNRDLTFGNLLLPLQFDLGSLNQREGSRNQSFAARTSVTIAGISSSITARLTRNALPSQPYGPIEGGVGILASGRIGRVTLRGDVNYRLGVRCAFSDAHLTGLWSLSDKDSWQAGAGYSWDSRRSSFSLGYSHSFQRFTLSATAAGDTGGAMTALLGLRFSLGPDQTGRLRKISSERLASSGTLNVFIFRDSNGDGVRQPDEATEADAGVNIAGQRARAGAADNDKGTSGLALHGLPPAATVMIGIDPTSLSDPLLDPFEKAVRIVPRKGLAMHLDMAVAAFGVIEGEMRNADGSPAADTPVALFNVSGAQVAQTRTDFDGSFVFEKVRYGRYTLMPRLNQSATKPIAILLDNENPSAHARLKMVM